MDLPDLAKPGNWSNKHKARLKEARKQVENYQQTSQQLADLSKKARRNRYNLELLTAVNDFQITMADLLLALKQCDTNNKAEREEGTKAVEVILDKFENTWDKLKEVYSHRRFISYPEGYVKDRYFHRASKREDMSFIILDQQEYLPKVSKWLKEQNQ